MDSHLHYRREYCRVAERVQALKSSLKTPCLLTRTSVRAIAGLLCKALVFSQLAWSAKLDDRWYNWQWHNALAGTLLLRLKDINRVEAS
jgi:hypothetical protein